MLNKDKEILISADGAARNNGKPNAIGGWGFVIVQDDQAVIEGYGSIPELNTNNQNEIKSITDALAKLIESGVSQNAQINVEMDSAYVLNCVKDEWYISWIKNGWKNAKKQPVANKELWLVFLEHLLWFDNISFNKIKGHSGNKWNEMADRLANLAMDEAEEALSGLASGQFVSESTKKQDLIAAIKAEKLKY